MVDRILCLCPTVSYLPFDINYFYYRLLIFRNFNRLQYIIDKVTKDTLKAGKQAHSEMALSKTSSHTAAL